MKFLPILYLLLTTIFPNRFVLCFAYAVTVDSADHALPDKINSSDCNYSKLINSVETICSSSSSGTIETIEEKTISRLSIDHNQSTLAISSLLLKTTDTMIMTSSSSSSTSTNPTSNNNHLVKRETNTYLKSEPMITNINDIANITNNNKQPFITGLPMIIKSGFYSFISVSGSSGFRLVHNGTTMNSESGSESSTSGQFSDGWLVDGDGISSFVSVCSDSGAGYGGMNMVGCCGNGVWSVWFGLIGVCGLVIGLVL
ncbi:unnamed protein product [Ambrosiozyma monospora]|uniref:Unnamed protein product n=1 Tax=Ambrosiozyma monospora TaxID=43982 RepID=A0ACB5TXV8_AMBMO|nr:unnamed protein product [Ambrosiozyma monospora]